MAINLSKCTQDCHSCIKSYAKKHRLKPGDKFKVACSGIPLNYVDEATAAQIGTSFSAELLLDPVKWAAEILDWHCLDPDGEVWKRKDPEEYAEMMEQYPGRPSKFHRPQQATMLRCTAKRKVFRIGRQFGKCLPSGTLIQMANGLQKPIEEVVDGELVVSMDENYQAIHTPAFRACNGEKPVAKITLMDGREIEATYNHPFLSRAHIGRETTGARAFLYQDEWLRVDELSAGDYIAVPRKIHVEGKNSFSPELITLVGCMIADGNLTSRNCRFSNTNPEILEAMRHSVEWAGCSLKQYESDASCDYHIIGEGSGCPHRVRNIFRELGLWGLSSHEKFIPDMMMQMSDENTRILLRALFGCDGWASVDDNNRVEIGFATVSEKLAKQVVSLLARFGIYSSMSLKTVKLNGQKYFSRQLSISRKESIANFRNKIGVLGKDARVEEVFLASQQKGSSSKTEAYEDNDLVFIRIRSIEDIGTKMTWDLSVPETKNFIANNILTHNTETLVVSMLFHMFTNQNFKIVLITPYQSQIDLIFKRLEELIQANPSLQNSIKRNVKAPQYTLQLYNNSQIKGFTAGTKSGSGAGAARGQSANMLVFDEADYLDSKDMDAAMSIITNFPNATVWMSSTPSGKRDKFYEVCHSPEWKEYHFPSYLNPNWNEQLENTFRSVLTEIGYKHEILSDFGEQEEGVFQVPYVEAAEANYTYDQCKPDHTWLYAIGVDWNSPSVGTTICVTGFNPASQKFRVVERYIVQRAGWTQLAACEAIVSLNRKWRPFAIYVDKGYGATQIEVIHKYGYDARRDPDRGKTHVDSKLPKIVKAYDFGSSIETRDPFTGQKIKKPAKGFLVESSVRRFESGDIQFPESDETLKAELLNYIVKNVTVTGQFVYGVNNDAVGDHNLDAMMLSVVAFVLEKTSFGKPNMSEGINFTTLDYQEQPAEYWVPVSEEKKITRKDLINKQHPQAEAELNGPESKLKPWVRPGWETDTEEKEMRRIKSQNMSGRSRSHVVPLRSRQTPNKRNTF